MTSSRPGSITRYEHDDLLRRVDEMHQDVIALERALRELERKVWYMIGSAAVAAGAFSLLAATIVYHITHGG